jgi:hypothetical protein
VAHEVEREPARSAGPSPSGIHWERRFWLALGAALALHATFAVIAARRSPRLVQRPEPRSYLEVSLLDEAPPPPEVEVMAPAEADLRSSPSQSVSRAPQQAIASRNEPSRATSPSEPAVLDTAAPPEASAAPPAAGATGAPPTGLSLDALGVGTNPFLGMKGLVDGPERAAPPAPPREAPDRTRVAELRLKQYLVGGMLAHDRAAGASRNGAVVTALRDAAMLVSSPVNGEAEFVATIDATGLVTALRATRGTGSAADWRNVAAHALKALSKRRLRVPAGAAGLEVRLALSSKVQLPSGSSSVATLHQVPLLSEDGTRLSRLELPKESNKLPDATDPGALGTPMMRQPIPGGGLDSDVADLGATGRRIVHVTITDERPL